MIVIVRNSIYNNVLVFTLQVACTKPLYVRYTAKQTILEAINYDTHFLHSNAMMDYSMLVGIDKERCGKWIPS